LVFTKLHTLLGLPLTFVLLLSFFTANTSMYISWLLDDQIECLETGEKEKEGEKEEQQKKEKESFDDDQVNITKFAIKYAARTKIDFASNYFWNHYLEVPTPPPELA